MPIRRVIFVSMVIPTWLSCTRAPECNMRECGENTYELALYSRPTASGAFEPSDTLKPGEAAFLVIMTRMGSGSDQGHGDCQSCNSLLYDEKLFSDLDVLDGSDTVKAGINLLDSSLASRRVPGEHGGWQLRPDVKLKRGSNRFRYQAEMGLKGKLLQSISDTLRFWVDSSVGY